MTEDPNYDRKRLKSGWIDVNRDEGGVWRISWATGQGCGGVARSHLLAGGLRLARGLPRFTRQGRPDRVGHESLAGRLGAEWAQPRLPLERQKAPVCGAFGLSGRRDSNSGPLVPQTSALTRLRHAPRRFAAYLTSRIGLLGYGWATAGLQVAWGIARLGT